MQKQEKSILLYKSINYNFNSMLLIIFCVVLKLVNFIKVLQLIKLTGSRLSRPINQYRHVSFWLFFKAVSSSWKLRNFIYSHNNKKLKKKSKFINIKNLNNLLFFQRFEDLNFEFYKTTLDMFSSKVYIPREFKGYYFNLKPKRPKRTISSMSYVIKNSLFPRLYLKNQKYSIFRKLKSLTAIQSLLLFSKRRIFNAKWYYGRKKIYRAKRRQELRAYKKLLEEKKIIDENQYTWGSKFKKKKWRKRKWLPYHIYKKARFKKKTNKIKFKKFTTKKKKILTKIIYKNLILNFLMGSKLFLYLKQLDAFKSRNITFKSVGSSYNLQFRKYFLNFYYFLRRRNNVKFSMSRSLKYKRRRYKRRPKKRCSPFRLKFRKRFSFKRKKRNSRFKITRSISAAGSNFSFFNFKKYKIILKRKHRRLAILKRKHRRLAILKRKRRWLTILKRKRRWLTILNRKRKGPATLKRKHRELIILKYKRMRSVILKSKSVILSIPKSKRKEISQRIYGFIINRFLKKNKSWLRSKKLYLFKKNRIKYFNRIVKRKNFPINFRPSLLPKKYLKSVRYYFKNYNYKNIKFMKFYSLKLKLKWLFGLRYGKFFFIIKQIFYLYKKYFDLINFFKFILIFCSRVYKKKNFIKFMYKKYFKKKISKSFKNCLLLKKKFGAITTIMHDTKGNILFELNTRSVLGKDQYFARWNWDVDNIFFRRFLKKLKKHRIRRIDRMISEYNGHKRQKVLKWVVRYLRHNLRRFRIKIMSYKKKLNISHSNFFKEFKFKRRKKKKVRYRKFKRKF